MLRPAFDVTGWLRRRGPGRAGARRLDPRSELRRRRFLGGCGGPCGAVRGWWTLWGAASWLVAHFVRAGEADWWCGAELAELGLEAHWRCCLGSCRGSCQPGGAGLRRSTTLLGLDSPRRNWHLGLVVAGLGRRRVGPGLRETRRPEEACIGGGIAGWHWRPDCGLCCLGFGLLPFVLLM
ncbi:hypothetical protein NDU88_009528 [Pleurodeles waltl]|uniref:Uncharacterized protein n=1 Tax=Pleurodeles waltl TaxID=8319 RepID=A0AAV7QRT1_PLEWA|nr:hypothetical protein NDU88_009528 [Pleurodeles waltl]